MAFSVSERQAKRLEIALGEEFGCEVSLPTLHPAKGGHFILRVQALHGNPYDGHTLEAASFRLEMFSSCFSVSVSWQRDAVYRGT